MPPKRHKNPERDSAVGGLGDDPDDTLRAASEEEDSEEEEEAARQFLAAADPEFAEVIQAPLEPLVPVEEEEILEDPEPVQEPEALIAQVAPVAPAPALVVQPVLAPLPQPLVPPPAPAVQIMAYAGSQIALIPSYDGDKTKDVEMWMATVDRCVQQFNWHDNEQICSVVKNKLTGKAAFWLETERRKGTEIDIWEDVVAAAAVAAVVAQAGPPIIAAAAAIPAVAAATGLKTIMIRRFRLRLEAMEATEAVMDLHFRAGEAIHEFFDRVAWAIEVKNHTFTPAQKLEPGYIQQRDADVFAFFCAGLPLRYREFAMTGAAPVTPDDLLQRCLQMEATTTKVKKINMLSTSVAEETTQQSQDGTEVKPDTAVEMLTKEIAALKAELKCYNCGGQGHFSRECPKPKKQPPSNQPQRRGGWRAGNRGNRGFRGYRGNRGNGGYRGGRGRGFTPAANFGQPYQQQQPFGYAQPPQPQYGYSGGRGGSAANAQRGIFSTHYSFDDEFNQFNQGN